MPPGPEHQHVEKAKHNERFLETILTSTFYVWIVVVTFYTALHFVDALLAKKNYHPSSHHKRNQLVAKFLPDVSEDYLVLYSRSRRVRYDPLSHLEFNEQTVSDVLSKLERIRSKIEHDVQYATS